MCCRCYTTLTTHNYHTIYSCLYIVIYSILYILPNVTLYIDIGVARALYVAVVAHSRKNTSIHLTM